LLSGQFVSLSGLDAGFENPNQLLALTLHKGKLGITPQPALSLDQSDPAACFPQFLEADLHFVDEILGGFRRLGFAMVPIGRGA